MTQDYVEQNHDEAVLRGAAAIERELRHWGWEPPAESMLKLCAARCVEAYLLTPDEDGYVHLRGIVEVVDDLSP